ncbi:MAG: hypothetical protein FJZ16_01775 [Candidatus Omnitrophica bacterium]|nr:hypothetical protein [Candidatus Omnitrophota bacterium]
MADVLRHFGVKDKGIVQTTNSPRFWRSSENCSSKHNLEVPGSNPGPATKFRYDTKSQRNLSLRHSFINESPRGQTSVNLYMFPMTPSSLILLGICSFIIGIILFIGAIRRFRLISSFLWLGVALCGLAIFFAGISCKTFIKFNKEELVARIYCERPKNREYDFNLNYTPIVKGKEQPSIIFPIRGKEWMLQGDIIKWKPFLNLLGLHTYYRITRICGRYPSFKNKVQLSDTIYSLQNETIVSGFLRKIVRKLPFVDAVYGNAVYTTCEFDRVLEIYVSTSGFIIR